MKRNFTVLLTILICSVTACQSGQKKDRNMDQETKLKIETTAGDIIVKLYNETPQHRDNFIKLAEEGTYEGTLFHRVIKDFMIQAGDPESKNAPKGKMLGAGDVGYTIYIGTVPGRKHSGATNSEVSHVITGTEHLPKHRRIAVPCLIG